MNRKEIFWIIFLILMGAVVGWYLTGKIYHEKSEVTMAGSAAMETFAETLAEVMEQYGVRIEPQFIGSSAGVEALLKGKAQLAMVSRYLTGEEKEQGIAENIIAYDGIVVIANAKNPIENLTKPQLAGIFSGKITNWEELGGEDEPIVPIGRELGSGTRTSFEKLLGIMGKSRYSNECDSIGIVKAKVELLPGAIGYVSMESVETGEPKEKSKVKVLRVEKVKPDLSSIEKGDYVLVRPFILATLGEVEKQPEEIQEIFEVLKEKRGVVVFERARVAPAKAGKA